MESKTPLNEIELISQVGDWAQKNFGYARNAELGIVEEIGEAAHCVLKCLQRIRGFDKKEVFMEHFVDSLADTIIYLADYCHVHHCFFKFGRNLHEKVKLSEDDERRVITHLLQTSAAMMAQPLLLPGMDVPAAEIGVYNVLAQRLCGGIEYWAAIYDVDLPLAVAATWEKVSKRDWKANPAAPLAGQQ